MISNPEPQTLPPAIHNRQSWLSRPSQILSLQSAFVRRLALAALLVLAAALSLWRFDAFQLGVYGDDAQYVVLARSLVDGPVYGMISQPNIPASKFPFGWPLLLAPLVALSGGEYGMLKIASLLFTLANTALIVLGWPYLGGVVVARSETGHSPRWKMLALPVGLLYATSPLVIDHSRMVMSEPAFLFFALAGLLLTGAREATARQGLLVGLMLGVAWVMAAYTRTIGVTLVAASVAWLLLQRRYGRLLLAALSAVVFVAVLVVATPLRWGDLFQGGRYMTELVSEPAVVDEHDLPEDLPAENRPTETLSLTTRIAYGLRGYGKTTVRDTLVPFIGGRTVAGLLGTAGLGWLPGLASGVILLVIAAGFVVSLRASGLRPAHLYVAAYVIVTLLWMWSLPRLLYGILPFLVAFMLAGLASVADGIASLIRRGMRRRTAFPTAFVAFVVLLLCAANIAASLRIGDSREHTPDLSAGTAWIRANTPADSIVLTAHPEATYLYADRQAIPLVSAAGSIGPGLARYGVSERPAYVLLAPDLVWRDDGALEVSPWVSSLAVELSASPHASLAYADSEQRVYVYAWLPSGGSH